MVFEKMSQIWRTIEIQNSFNVFGAIPKYFFQGNLNLGVSPSSNLQTNFNVRHF